MYFSAGESLGVQTFFAVTSYLPSIVLWIETSKRQFNQASLVQMYILICLLHISLREFHSSFFREK